MREIIGKPWAVPCSPPSSFDCWELVRYVRETYFALNTPSVVDRQKRKPSDRSFIKDPSKKWNQLLEPSEGCIVRVGENHVGVYIGSQGIIHSSASKGVSVDPLHLLLSNDVTYWELAHA